MEKIKNENGQMSPIVFWESDFFRGQKALEFLQTALNPLDNLVAHRITKGGTEFHVNINVDILLLAADQRRCVIYTLS